MANRSIEAEIRISARDKTARAFQSVSRRLDQMERQHGTVARQMDRANTAMVAGMAQIVAPAAIGYGFKTAISSAADFEAALMAIQKKAGTTAEETARIGEEAKALATSGELAVPLEEILSAYERGAAAGIPLDELREFARLSAMAADAFEISAESVGNYAASLQVGLGVSMDQLEEYFGLINKLADSGIAAEGDLLEFLNRSGANLKLFGLTAEQAAAYAATLGNIKMEPETAARMMNTLTSKLLSPGSDKAQEAFAGIVGDVDKFQALQKSDANKAIEEFLKHVSSLDKFKSAELLTGFLGQDFSDEVLRLAAAFEELQRNQAIALDRSGWATGLSDTYALKLDDFWSQWQLFKNEVKMLTIDLGDMGLPAAQSALEGLRGTVREIGTGLETLKAEVDTTELDAATTALGDLYGAVEDLLNIEGGGSQIEQFFSDLADVINTAAAAVNTIEDGLQAIGLAAPDADTPEDRAKRRGVIADNFVAIDPNAPGERAFDAWRDATANTWNRVPDVVREPVEWGASRWWEATKSTAGRIGGMLGFGDEEFDELKRKAEETQQSIDDTLSEDLSPAISRSLGGARATLQQEVGAMVTDVESGMARIKAILSQPLKGPTISGPYTPAGGVRANVGRSMPELEGE